MNNLNARTMTTEEAALITAYRLSDARGKQAIMKYAASMSEDWPEPRIDSTTDDSGGES